MEKTAPNVPVRIIAPGKVYRRDDDATHSPMFHQVEGLAIDRNISLSDLKGTLLLFVRQMFELISRCACAPVSSLYRTKCGGGHVLRNMRRQRLPCLQGDGLAGNTWSGHGSPAGFEMSGYDPEEYTGYAFGMGVERIAMLKYG